MEAEAGNRNIRLFEGVSDRVGQGRFQIANCGLQIGRNPISARLTRIKFCQFCPVFSLTRRVYHFLRGRNQAGGKRCIQHLCENLVLECLQFVDNHLAIGRAAGRV
jgi:hypothetical protein